MLANFQANQLNESHVLPEEIPSKGNSLPSMLIVISALDPEEPLVIV